MQKKKFKNTKKIFLYSFSKTTKKGAQIKINPFFVVFEMLKK